MKKFWKKYTQKKEESTSTAPADAQEETGNVADTPVDVASNEEVQDKKKEMNLFVICRELGKHKKVYAIALSVIFVLSCLYAFNLPRYYASEAALAPEEENPQMNGGLGSLASSFGVDLSGMQSTDAINPTLYPDLMDDNAFVVDMFKIRVKTMDDSIQTDYYTYLAKYQKQSWADKQMGQLKKALNPKDAKGMTVATTSSPYILSKKDDEIVRTIRKNIIIRADKKTGVVTVHAEAQDPLVCKTLADSVTERLKGFIIQYRTSKAKKDVAHYKQLMDEAQKAYEKIRRKYGEYSDANTDVLLESVKSELEDMENDMQLKYNQYTTYNTQYQAATAKLLEKTPVFTQLKGASAPVKPAGPKRMLMVIGFVLLTFFAITAWYIVRLAFARK